MTLREDTQHLVIAAFNCGNLVAVAEQIRWKYPNAEILICGDNDHATEGNPGQTKAIEAATRCGGDWVVPDLTGLNPGPKDTDFNDFAGHLLVSRHSFDSSWPAWEMHPSVFAC